MTKKTKINAALTVFLAALYHGTPALADMAEVKDVKITAEGAGLFRFDTTIAHGDTGWEHYADGWRIELADGTEIGFRELMHPHVSEQPFTRSLPRVAVPKGVDTVFVRARDSLHGWTEDRFVVSVPGR